MYRKRLQLRMLCFAPLASLPLHPRARRDQAIWRRQYTIVGHDRFPLLLVRLRWYWWGGVRKPWLQAKTGQAILSVVSVIPTQGYLHLQVPSSKTLQTHTCLLRTHRRWKSRLWGAVREWGVQAVSAWLYHHGLWQLLDQFGKRGHWQNLEFRILRSSGSQTCGNFDERIAFA